MDAGWGVVGGGGGGGGLTIRSVDRVQQQHVGGPFHLYVVHVGPKQIAVQLRYPFSAANFVMG